MRQSQQWGDCTNKRAPRGAVPLCTLAWLPQHSRRPAVIRPALRPSNRNRHARCFGRVLVGFRERRPTTVSQDWPHGYRSGGPMSGLSVDSWGLNLGRPENANTEFTAKNTENTAFYLNGLAVPLRSSPCVAVLRLFLVRGGRPIPRALARKLRQSFDPHPSPCEPPTGTTMSDRGRTEDTDRMRSTSSLPRASRDRSP
jgi:hypothetical protein